jgi:hypothetical protein
LRVNVSSLEETEPTLLLLLALLLAATLALTATLALLAALLLLLLTTTLAVTLTTVTTRLGHFILRGAIFLTRGSKNLTPTAAATAHRVR